MTTYDNGLHNNNTVRVTVVLSNSSLQCSQRSLHIYVTHLFIYFFLLILLPVAAAIDNNDDDAGASVAPTSAASDLRL